MDSLPIFNYIFYVQFVGTIAYAGFVLWILLGLRRLNQKPTNIAQPFVSVIIPVRNEEETIAACLQALLFQSYPIDKYEVIVVDDHSEDATYSIIASFAHERLKLLSLTDFDGMSPKKAAIHTGIQASRGDIILTTDADCHAPDTWVETMVKYFDNKTGVVASWLYVETNHRLLSKLESLDSLALSAVGAAGFGWERPILANGANFAYRRTVYDEINGFDGVAGFVSGDDDLLLQKIRARGTWRCAFSPDSRSMIVTQPTTSLRAFFEQRFRWASKGQAYPKFLVFFEVFIYFYFLSLLILPIAFIMNGFSPIYVVAPLFIKMLLDAILMRYATEFVRKKQNPVILFLTEWLQILYVIIVGFWGLRGSYTWKGRRYSKGRVR